ncbi:glutathione synthetase, putative [Theileria equi strain WA]|uniref:Glutathione synthetase n=1 Tax=Theileria equi strain WA TaxID=1537102 RepID=L0AZ79_THEEQ|nr:glutathione synthetase, putative [Theileria equi strain WA]AFZ80321.1 glutathione synthetase, putative [Theileria equi strain WA]|eukprot:XP_004829987.1 glutathione synthetase, putative [Theileria equi strain WA]
MTSLNQQLLNLLSSFTKETEKHETGLFKFPKKTTVVVNDDNRRILVDTVRSFISKSGLTQASNAQDALDDENTCLSAYGGRIKFINFVLAPLPYPLRIYERCKAFTPIFAQLIDEMCSHLDELDELFSPITSVDPFVKGLLEISREVYGPNGRDYNKDIRVYINRADYILHSEEIAQQSNSKTSNEENMHCTFCHFDHCLCNSGTDLNSDRMPFKSNEKTHKIDPIPKLVEVNVIASSLSYPSGQLFKTHRRMIKHHIIDRGNSNSKKREDLTSEMEKTHVTNYPIRFYVDTLAASHNLYIEKHPPIFGKHKVSILLVISQDMSNYFDINSVSENLHEEYGILVNVLTVEQLCNLMRQRKLLLVNEWEVEDGSVRFTRVSTHYTEKKPGRLILLNNELDDSATLKDFTGCYEVSVLYYRTWYDPSCIESYKDAWSLRLLCEYSDAVKVPSAPAQLASSKRGQMIWSDPKHIDRLLASHKKRVKGEAYNEELLDAVKETYILQVDPSLDVNAEIVNDAIQNPHRYVLKSQREGGMGLVSSQELESTLRNKDGLSQYVLMKLITPPVQPTLFVRNIVDGRFSVDAYESITELGIYGFTIYDGNACKLATTGGYLARTKPEFVSGGGVCAGFGSLNSLIFF